MGRWQGEQMKGEKEKKKKKKILCRVYYNHVVTQSETSSSHPARYNIYCDSIRNSSVSAIYIQQYHAWLYRVTMPIRTAVQASPSSYGKRARKGIEEWCASSSTSAGFPPRPAPVN
jgi:hypothetical protein